MYRHKERETDRQTDRPTDRRERGERERECVRGRRRKVLLLIYVWSLFNLLSFPFIYEIWETLNKRTFFPSGSHTNTCINMNNNYRPDLFKHLTLYIMIKAFYLSVSVSLSLHMYLNIINFHYNVNCPLYDIIYDIIYIYLHAHTHICIVYM